MTDIDRIKTIRANALAIVEDCDKQLNQLVKTEKKVKRSEQKLHDDRFLNGYAYAIAKSKKQLTKSK